MILDAQMEEKDTQFSADFGEVVIVGNGGGAVIDDSQTSANTTWSSEKISNKIESVDGSADYIVFLEKSEDGAPTSVIKFNWDDAVSALISGGSVMCRVVKSGEGIASSTFEQYDLDKAFLDDNYIVFTRNNENVSIKTIYLYSSGYATYENYRVGTVASVNGITPDENGNVQIDIGGGSAEGAVLYTEQDLTDAQKAQARENIGALSVDVIGEPTILSSADFVNGKQTIGQGIVDEMYWITLATPVPVKIGDKITIKPNGLSVVLNIESVDNFSNVVTHLVNKTISTDTVYISEYDGFCFISARDSGWQEITPASYVCDISIGASRITVLEEQMAEADKRMDDFEETIPVVRYASPKHKPFTRIVNDCQDASKWILSNNSADISSVDTDNFIIGTQSLRSDKQMRCVKNTYDMLHNDLVVKFRINSIATGAKLFLAISHLNTPSKLVRYELARGSAWTTPTDWQEIAIPYTGHEPSSASVAADFDFSKVEDLIFHASEGAVDWNLQYVGLRPKTMKNGIVTFIFDDGYKSQYAGIKTLAEKGITGTIFHIKEATENNQSGEYLTVYELQELVNRYGADIEVHGDPSYDQWDAAELVEHWANSQKWLKENGLSEGKHMAYPNGIFPDNVVQLARNYFDSCRTIKPFIPLETYPPADRYRIRAVSGVGSTAENVEAVKRHIDNAVNGGAWLILVFHVIDDVTGDSMHCSEANLKAIADYAIESGAYIMNYAEVFDSGVVM